MKLKPTRELHEIEGLWKNLILKIQTKWIKYKIANADRNKK